MKERLREQSDARQTSGGHDISRLAKVKRIARSATPVVFAIALLLPLFETDILRLRILTVAWLLSTLAMGATLSLGFGGLFNMSQGTFYGIGAYTTANMVGKSHLPFELAFVVSTAVAAMVGLALALTSLRVRGDLWALVSMAFTVSVVKVFENLEPITNGKDGISVPFQSVLGIPIDTPQRFYYLALGLTLVSFVLLTRLAKSFQGRAMLAATEDDVASAMMGVSLVQVKLGSLAVAAGLAGAAGSVLMATTLFVTPSSFEFLRSFDVMLFAIVGGVGSFLGSILAVVFLTFVTEAFRGVSEYRLGVYGLALLGAIFLRTGVFGDAFRRLKDRWGRRHA
jgi:branched-chain amino acid transport system permease protein